MDDRERREASRKDSLNFLDYVVLDQDGRVVDQGMGRTRNVSEKGLLLQTHVPLEDYHTVLITLGLEDDVVELRGTVVHEEFCPDEGICSGIEFTQIDSREREVLQKYLRAFQAGQVG